MHLYRSAEVKVLWAGYLWVPFSLLSIPFYLDLGVAAVQKRDPT